MPGWLCWAKLTGGGLQARTERVFSMIRTFVNTFLNTDGTPFTDRAGYETMEFYDECQNRDARLAQTIRTPGV